MKTLKTITATILIAAFAAVPLASFAGPKKDEKSKKPYPLDTCIVSGEKLEKDGMKTFTFSHEGQEIKLCCKSCLKKFNAEPAKYMKKMQEAQAKAKAKS
jgi:hypothetical protein